MSLTDGRFTMRNESFVCVNCQKNVPPLKSGCRNHCPFCLTSLHVDINPGDRSNKCGGLMDAVRYEIDAQKGLMLCFKCRRCGVLGRNKAAHEAPDAPDDYEKILRLPSV